MFSCFWLTSHFLLLHFFSLSISICPCKQHTWDIFPLSRFTYPKKYNKQSHEIGYQLTNLTQDSLCMLTSKQVALVLSDQYQTWWSVLAAKCLKLYYGETIKWLNTGWRQNTNSVIVCVCVWDRERERAVWGHVHVHVNTI